MSKEEVFEHQTAGHAGSMLKQGKDRLMKPVSKNEAIFYETFYKKFPKLQQYCPRFYGTEQKEDKMYAVLEDLTAQFKKPCIMDIKIGTSSVGEDASEEKKASMKAKDDATTTTTLGIRLSGFRVYQPKKGEYVLKDKSFGKKVKDNTMTDSLAVFFNNGEKVRKHVVEAFLAKVKEVQQWMESQKDLRFYSSSLLFLYEGDETDTANPKVDLRMIDFAHVHPIKDGGRDEGYVTGVKNLVRVLGEVAHK